MRVIARSTLIAFWTDSPEYADARPALQAWYREALNANWSTPNEVKDQFANASILRDGRVVFNIAGNKYRLVVWVNYAYRVVYIRFVGTHAHYDEIDAQTIRGSAMEIRPIRTEEDYRTALRQIEQVMDAGRDTPEGDRLDVLATLVEAWERTHYPIDFPDPIDAIRFRMEQQGLTVDDLVPIIGRKNRVYEVLARKRQLTLRMIEGLHETLEIPAESLLKRSGCKGAVRS